MNKVDATLIVPDTPQEERKSVLHKMIVAKLQHNKIKVSLSQLAKDLRMPASTFQYVWDKFCKEYNVSYTVVITPKQLTVQADEKEN